MARIQPQVPQLSINGGAFSPSSLGNGSPNGSLNGNGSAAVRSPKSPAVQTPTSTIEVDSAWGANFWVTLIEPQVRALSILLLPMDHRNSNLTEPDTVLRVPCDRAGQLGPARRELRVRLSSFISIFNL